MTTIIWQKTGCLSLFQLYRVADRIAAEGVNLTNVFVTARPEIISEIRLLFASISLVSAIHVPCNIVVPDCFYSLRPSNDIPSSEVWFTDNRRLIKYAVLKDVFIPSMLYEKQTRRQHERNDKATGI